jgi:hypothetical protein
LPGSSGIAGVRVRETQSGETRLTDAQGSYLFAGLTSARLTFEAEGYEPLPPLDAVPNQFNDTPLQRIVRLTAGGSLTALELAPHDVTYMVGPDLCYPCKLIRVAMPGTGTLRVNLTWSEVRANTLNVWVNGLRFVGDGTVLNITKDVQVPSGEVLVYVGFHIANPVVYVPFTLTTSTGGGP